MVFLEAPGGSGPVLLSLHAPDSLSPDALFCSLRTDILGGGVWQGRGALSSPGHRPRKYVSPAWPRSHRNLRCPFRSFRLNLVVPLVPRQRWLRTDPTCDGSRTRAAAGEGRCPPVPPGHPHAGQCSLWRLLPLPHGSEECTFPSGNVRPSEKVPSQSCELGIIGSSNPQFFKNYICYNRRFRIYKMRFFFKVSLKDMLNHLITS